MSFPTMEIPQEIEFLSGFLLDQLPTLPRSLQPIILDRLFTRYLPHHWYPDQSERGSGFRAISFDPNRQDGYLDPILRLIASDADLTPKQFKKALANNHHGWTVWCDPGCVSIRYQSGGAELRELWGSLPQHLISPINSPPRLPNSNSPSLIAQSSPCKSRAIPIMAPSTAARLAGVTSLALIPPTPMPEQRVATVTEVVDDADDAELALHINRPFSLRSTTHSRQSSKQLNGEPTLGNNMGGRLSPITSDDDPFLRPESRSSSSSSSSGSDHSAFSGGSISSNSTVPSAPHHLRKTSASATVPISHAHQAFVRHHSTSSLPYTLPASQVNQFQAPPFAFPAHQPPAFLSQPITSRSSSPAPGGNGGRRLRERHYSSASISSVTSNGSITRHGGLVMKEGPGTVTEHSGGKVGVMGGGVLLGLPKTDAANAAVKVKNTNPSSSRRNGRRGRGSHHLSSLSSIANFQ